MSYVDGASPVNPYTQAGGLDAATIGGPGYTHQGLKTRPGEVFEPEVVATNHLLWTDTLTNAVWTNSGFTVATYTNNQDFLVKYGFTLTSVAVSKTILQNMTIPSTTSVWFTVWVKVISGTATGKISLRNNTTTTTIDQVFTATTTWQYVKVQLTGAGITSVRATITFDPVGTLYVSSPQITVADDPFTLYIKSEGTKGTYSRVLRRKRFVMYENIAIVPDSLLTPMEETPNSSTAKMIESVR